MPLAHSISVITRWISSRRASFMLALGIDNRSPVHACGSPFEQAHDLRFRQGIKMQIEANDRRRRISLHF
jgi:hypothetical protein